MPYLNLDTDYFRHPKTVRLVEMLGRGSEVLPLRLWALCATYFVDGRLTGIAAHEIEAQVGWWGNPGQMIQAFVECGKPVGKKGFLDPMLDGGFLVHGWDEHEGHIQAFKTRAKKAAAARWNKLSGESEVNNDNASSKRKHPNASSIPKQCPSRTYLPTYLPPQPLLEASASPQSRNGEEEELKNSSDGAQPVTALPAQPRQSGPQPALPDGTLPPDANGTQAVALWQRCWKKVFDTHVTVLDTDIPKLEAFVKEHGAKNSARAFLAFLKSPGIKSKVPAVLLNSAEIQRRCMGEGKIEDDAAARAEKKLAAELDYAHGLLVKHMRDPSFARQHEGEIERLKGFARFLVQHDRPLPEGLTLEEA